MRQAFQVVLADLACHGKQASLAQLEVDEVRHTRPQFQDEACQDMLAHAAGAPVVALRQAYARCTGGIVSRALRFLKRLQSADVCLGGVTASRVHPAFGLAKNKDKKASALCNRRNTYVDVEDWTLALNVQVG
jgi:hypothetical protein